MKFSHADYMAEQIHKIMLQLRAEYPVKMLADLAGCSASLIYSWSESADDAKAKYILALAAQLADRGDYRWILMLLPAGARVVSGKRTYQVNGSCDDEVTDGTIALAQASLSHRGRNPDQIAEARRALREVEHRLEEEEINLRAQLAGQAPSAIGPEGVS